MLDTARICYIFLWQKVGGAMKDLLDPDVIDKRILELAAETHVGGAGLAISAVRNILGKMGVPFEDVMTALEILLRKGYLKVKSSSKKNPLEDVSSVMCITAEGKDHLRRLTATTQFNVRVPVKLLRELEALVRRGDSTSGLAVQALNEWVRMAKYPGIDFRWTPTGRKPHVTGTGLSVWEVHQLWMHHKRNVEKLVANYPHLSPTQVNAALGYAAAYLDEMVTGEFGARPGFAREFKV
jgi:uncharacterized protein (DUF433 family)